MVDVHGAPRPAGTRVPTYDLRAISGPGDRYLDRVATMADEVIALGREVQDVIDAYGRMVDATGKEPRRSDPEYLLEALMLGVLWRVRGVEATSLPAAEVRLMEEIAAERRAGRPKRRDGSSTRLLARSWKPAEAPASPGDVDRLLTWLVASCEYDDEVQRLEGWQELLRRTDAASAVLRRLHRLAVRFEDRAWEVLGAFTTKVDGYLGVELPPRVAREEEDAVQCSRQRSEYHLNMVGAEILNRAWRPAFLRCRRHVVVMPGCMRRLSEERCASRRSEVERRCTHCHSGCEVSAATRLAVRTGGDAVAVLHGSDLTEALRRIAARGDDVAIVGVACVPGLIGAGLRARALGLPAQCVLLNASGCAHWQRTAVPTGIDLVELRRVLRRPTAIMPGAAAAEAA